MHKLHEMGDPDVKPNVVSYGAVIDCFSKCGEADAASRADSLLASMIQLHQSDPIRHADLLPNTYVFNCCLNCWAKSKEPDAASKAEEMLVAMSRLHTSGMESVKPDAFSVSGLNWRLLREYRYYDVVLTHLLLSSLASSTLLALTLGQRVDTEELLFVRNSFSTRWRRSTSLETLTSSPIRTPTTLSYRLWRNLGKLEQPRERSECCRTW